MVRLIGVVSGVLAAFAFLGQLADAQPSLEIVGGPKFDLGSLNRGEVVERELSLKNTGTDTLVLENVQASCGCTGTLVSNNRIPPGNAGTLKITFNSKNFTGPVHKSVTLRTNVPENSTTIIEFTANVMQEIIVDPMQFWFKDAEVGRPTSATLTFKNVSAQSVELRGYRTQLAGLTLKIPDGEIKPGTEVKIIAEFTPKNAMPVISDAVFLLTSNPRQAEIYVPVFGNAKEFKFE